MGKNLDQPTPLVISDAIWGNEMLCPGSVDCSAASPMCLRV